MQNIRCLRSVRVSALRGRRAAGLAVAAGLALVACRVGDATAPSVESTASAPTTTVVAQPPPTVDPATVESAVVRATGCSVDPRFGRDLDGIRFLMVGLGPSVGDPPQAALDGSFTCNVAPVGTLSVGAARFADPAQAVEVVTWFLGGQPCRPVAAVGPWMLFSGRPVEKPQVSPELEAVVAELGGRMTATCQ